MAALTFSSSTQNNQRHHHPRRPPRLLRRCFAGKPSAKMEGKPIAMDAMFCMMLLLHLLHCPSCIVLIPPSSELEQPLLRCPNSVTSKQPRRDQLSSNAAIASSQFCHLSSMMLSSISFASSSLVHGFCCYCFSLLPRRPSMDVAATVSVFLPRRRPWILLLEHHFCCVCSIAVSSAERTPAASVSYQPLLVFPRYFSQLLRFGHHRLVELVVEFVVESGQIYSHLRFVETVHTISG